MKQDHISERNRKLVNAYYNIFTSSDGELVLEHLHTVVKRTGIDGANPNPNQAVYAMAQLALLDLIENKIQEAQRKI